MTQFASLRPRGVVVLLIAGLTLGSTLTARAQSAGATGSSGQPANGSQTVGSRAEEIAREQAAKAPNAKPYQKSGAEKAIDVAEDFLVSPPTFYPWFGSIYPGGLFALGAGIRKPIGDTALFNVHGGYSLRGFSGIDARFHLPELARGKVKFDLYGSYINAPKVAFFGTGPSSDVDDRALYLYRPSNAGAVMTMEPVKHVVAGAGVEYLDAKTGAGRGDTSIEQRFNGVQAPGLGASPRYTRTNLFAGYDWRASPAYTTTGGWYHVEWYDYRQENAGPYSFRRTDAEVQQFIPLMRANWVIALRGLVSTTETKDGEQVPYFLMPDLGGGSELRGYPSFRFRGNHRVLLTGEYRWTAGQFVDMALFVDAGKVTDRRSELDLDHLKTTYGVGMRFHTPNATVLRIDVAKTREGIGLIFTAGQLF